MAPISHHHWADRVLQEIARLTGIRISASPAVLKSLITADVVDVETETALARVLAGYDRVLVFATAAEAGLRPALKEVRLFPATARSVAAPGSRTRTGDNDVASLLAGLHDLDPAVRAASIEALGRSGHEVPVDRVLAAGLGDHTTIRAADWRSSPPALPCRATCSSTAPCTTPRRWCGPRRWPSCRETIRASRPSRAALADQDAGVRDVARDVLAALKARQARR